VLWWLGAGRKRRAAVECFEDKSWLQAEQAGFKYLYRTTPDGWEKSLNGENIFVLFYCVKHVIVILF
jgi:hypothetical protein